MSKNIDKLFRDKLNPWESSPGPEAWQKLEDHLLRRKRKVLFWRLSVAASLLILISLGFIFWNRLPVNSPKPLVSEQAAIPETNRITAEEITPSPDHKEEILPQTTEHEEEVRVEEQNIEEQDGSFLAVKPDNSTKERTEIIRESEEVELFATNTGNPLADNSQQPAGEQIREQAAEELKLPPLTIEYKTSSAAVASAQTSDTVNNDSRGLIRKIRTFAREVKESDINLASFREAKDEFLAFDFEKKKDDSEVKKN